MLVGVAALDHCEAQSAPRQQFFDPARQGSGVAAIDKDAAQPAKALPEDRQDQFRSLSVLNGRRMHDDMEDQPQRVHQEMSFASQHLLACIVAAHASVVSHFNALRVEDRSGRGFFFPLRRRTRSRRVSCIFCQRPSRLQTMK